MLLALTPTTVHQIIALAEAYDTTRRRDWSDVPGCTELSPGLWLVPMSAVKGEADGDLARRDALYQAIRDLTCEEQAELKVLMWVGRGDADLDGWEWMIDEEIEKNERVGADVVASYVGGKVPLARYLRDGLRKLQAYCRSQQRRPTNRRRTAGLRADRRRRPTPPARRRGRTGKTS